MRYARTSDGLWASSGLAFVVLFAGGVIIADVLAGRPFPGMDEPVSEITGYFAANGAEVRLLSFFHSLAAVSLLAFAAYASGLDVSEERARRRLSTLALSGGVGGAVFLLLSALLYWTLARPATASEPALARSLADLSYLAGGVALLLPLSAFIGGTSLLAREAGVLPAWLVRTGLVTAIISLACAATLPAESGALGPGGIVALAAVPALSWIFAASIALIRASRARPRHAPSSATRSDDATASADARP